MQNLYLILIRWGASYGNKLHANTLKMEQLNMNAIILSPSYKCFKERQMNNIVTNKNLYYLTNNKNAEISHKAQKEMAHEQENVYSFL